MANTLKKGDEVVVIAGANRGRRGRILSILPKRDAVLIEGVNLRKKHERKTQENPDGAITEREAPIHRSNVMLASRHDAKQERRGAAASV